MPIKVLHVIQWPKGGIVSLIYNIILLLNNYGVESHVVFFDSDNEICTKFSKICNSVHSLKMSESYFMGTINWVRLIKKISPDIVHSHSFFSIMLALLLNWQKTACVVTVHGDYPYFKENKLDSKIKRIILKCVVNIKKTKMIAVSNSVSSSLIQAGINDNNIILIENGIYVKKTESLIFNKNKIRSELGIRTDDIVIISVGRLSWEKGFDILLTSFQIIQQKYGNIFLLILGEGSEHDNLMNSSEKLSIANNVKLLGFKESPFPYLLSSDIYVCSSLYEGLSLSIAEAMLLGLPVVATKVGGNPDMITHGESGLLVEPGVPSAISAALDDLISNRFNKGKLGTSARKCIEKRYDIKSTAMSYFNLYENLLGEKRQK